MQTAASKRQADAVRWLQPRSSSPDAQMGPHAHTTCGGVLGFQVSGSGRRCADVSRVHSTKRSTAYMLTRRRDEAALRLESCARISRGRAVTIRIRRVRSARTAGFIPIRDRCQPAGAWSRPLLCAVRLAPVRSMDWRGRVRRIGATLPAAKTHARSQGMPA